MRAGLVVVTAIFWMQVVAAEAATPVPLVGADAVRPNPVLLVKSKKKKAAESDDAGDPSSRGVMDYLTASVTFSDFGELAEEVEENKIGGWVLGALFATYGGHIWAPMIFYKDVPKNQARTNAMILGVIGIFAPLVVLCGFPCLWIPFINLLILIPLAALGFFLNWYVIPKAVTLAYSDAYAVGDDGGGDEGDEDKPRKKKKKKKKPVEEEQEEE